MPTQRDNIPAAMGTHQADDAMSLSNSVGSDVTCLRVNMSRIHGI